MGCCCAKQIGLPPTDQRLVGTWVNDRRALEINVGCAGAYRLKRGRYRFGGHGGTGSEGEPFHRLPKGLQVGVRMTIDNDGCLHYIQFHTSTSDKKTTDLVEDGSVGIHYELIDLAVTSWDGGVIQCNGCGSCCHADFPYRFTSTSDTPPPELVITRNGEDYTLTKVGTIIKK